MKALVFYVNPAGWITCKWLRRFWRGCLTSRLNGIALREMELPSLPTGQWVRLRTLLGGICGSDTAVMLQKQRPDSILQAYSSMPAVFGHENVAIVEQAGPEVDSSWLGRRVCVEPTLGCQARQIDPMCDNCRCGQSGACENFSGTAGGLAGLPAGTSIGYNSRTGGSFGEYFVAHQSQLVAVPDEIEDELAVLTDPVACSLHAVLRARLGGAGRVLVYGSGVLGLGVVACLRAVGYDGQIDVLGRSGWLADVACELGASDYLRSPSTASERFALVAERTDGRAHRVRLGNWALSGGYDLTFECAGSAAAVSECLKFTASRGQVVLVGTAGRAQDITPIWFKEQTVLGAYGRGLEQWQSRTVGTYQLVHEMMLDGRLGVRGMLTHVFGINDWKRALWTAADKSARHAIKVAFDWRREGSRE